MQASIHDWATRSRPLALVRRLEPGAPLAGAADGAGCAPEKCWSELAALGVFSIALPAKAGGAGGTVTGLALRGEAAAPAAQGLLPAVGDGRSSVATGLSAAPVTGTWQADGTLRV